MAQKPLPMVAEHGFNWLVAGISTLMALSGLGLSAASTATTGCR
jgi:hypothetical protein